MAQEILSSLWVTKIWPRDSILVKGDEIWPRDTILIKGDENMTKRYLSSLRDDVNLWPIDTILIEDE